LLISAQIVEEEEENHSEKLLQLQMMLNEIGEVTAVFKSEIF
jgi:hypothetical protein